MSEVAIAGITTFSILGAAAVGIIYSIFGSGSDSSSKRDSDHDAYSEYHAKEARDRASTAHEEAGAASPDSGTGSGTGSGKRSRKSRRSRRSGRSVASRRHAKHCRRH